MDKRGMSLIEVLVGVVLLAVAGLGVTSTVALVKSENMRSAGGGSLDLQAAANAREYFEKLKNAVSSDSGKAAALEVTSPTFGNGEYIQDGGDLQKAHATISHTIESVPGTDKLKKVTVTVSWPD